MFPARAAAPLPLELSSEECDEYTQVAHSIRDDAIIVYESYLARTADSITTETAPAFEHRDWKRIKAKDRFQIYASRDKQHATVYQSTHAPYSEIHRSAEWQPQCKLRCVGSLDGSLDDVMYGGATPTERAMMVRSLTVHDHFIDHKALCDITIPTVDDPFTYLGLKWSARPPFLATMVRPRDMTYLQSTGFATIKNGDTCERVGCFVYHSMAIPGVPEFTAQHSFRRCRMSLCVIWRPTAVGTIDVFATIATDSGGDMPRNVTTLLSAKSLINLDKAMHNARMKKLVWLRGAVDRMSLSLPTLGGGTAVIATSGCPHCLRERERFAGVPMLQPRTRCDGCASRVCSRCITTQTVVRGRTKAELTRVRVATCKRCLAVASQMDVRELAVREFVRPFEFDFSIDNLPSTESISTNFSFSRDFSFFGARDSTGPFFSVRGSDRRSSSSQSASMCGSVSDDGTCSSYNS